MIPLSPAALLRRILPHNLQPAPRFDVPMSALQAAQDAADDAKRRGDTRDYGRALQRLRKLRHEALRG
jgi:hypothetical protein